MRMIEMKKMTNFTVGPVQSNDIVNKIGSEQVPYFRTEEFSNLMFENEKLIKKFIKANDEEKVVFITGSGTASMEATIINTLNKNDKALIVNGGSFGERFVELCEIHEIPYDDIKLNIGQPLTKEILENYDGNQYTAFLINLHETSTGVLYNLDLISEFCTKNNLFLIVDAISSFLTDEINMSKYNIDVIISGSQKALACPPGISFIALSKKALKRIDKNNPKCLYLNLKIALKNAERGQTPFTPAVSILRQINARLKEIDNNGGVELEIKKVKELANYFRNNIKDLPLKLVTSSPSNAVTSLFSINNKAYDIFLHLKDNYNIWICPNGGNLKDSVFRVGHIGNLTKKDYDELINALHELNKKGLL
jgi:aspartate aminotransferase-like enzyme